MQNIHPWDEVCNQAESCTTETTMGIGSWLGDGQSFKVRQQCQIFCRSPCLLHTLELLGVSWVLCPYRFTDFVFDLRVILLTCSCWLSVYCVRLSHSVTKTFCG